HLPAIDASMLAQLLDVGDEVPGRVVDQRRVRRAAPAAALVEEHDAVALGVEEATLLGVGASARPAVQEDDRLALRVARRLLVQAMSRAHVDDALRVRLDRRIGGAATLHRGEPAGRIVPTQAAASDREHRTASNGPLASRARLVACPGESDPYALRARRGAG